jgi:hypothetical protein
MLLLLNIACKKYFDFLISINLYNLLKKLLNIKQVKRMLPENADTIYQGELMWSNKKSEL